MQIRFKVGALVAAIGLTLSGMAAIAPAAHAAAALTASDTTDLVDGQSITLTGTGFDPNGAVTVLECNRIPTEADGRECDLGNLGSATANGSGGFSLTFKVSAGRVGDGFCPGKLATDQCVIIATQQTPTGFGAVAVDFAPTIVLTPSTNLKNKGKVKVQGLGFPASTDIFNLQCSTNPPTGTTCDTGNLVVATSSAGGAYNATVTVRTGAIGTGTCKAGGRCFITASNEAQTAFALAAFRFAKAPKATKTVAKFSKRTDRVTGTVKSAGKGVKGLKVKLQRKAGKVFKVVATLTTGKAGVFRSGKVKKVGVYRVFTPRQKGYSSSVSKTFRVTR